MGNPITIKKARLLTLKKHDSKNRTAMYHLYVRYFDTKDIVSATKMIKEDLMNPSQHKHAQNWRAWVTMEIRPGTPISDEDAKELAGVLAARLGAPVKACRHNTGMAYDCVDILCLNEDPKTGRALKIGKGELRGLQEAAVAWMREHGYESDRVRETAAELKAEKVELEKSVSELRTEAEETQQAMKDMESAMQETSVAVGVYREALKAGQPRPHIPDKAIQRAREYVKGKSAQSPAMAIMSRVLERQEVKEILGAIVILNPAIVASLLVAAAAVTAYRTQKQQQSRPVGAASTPPEEKEKREGLTEMVKGLQEQVREAISAVEGLNHRMDTMEQQQREEDDAPVVLRVREDVWTAEMRDTGRIYVRENEKIVAADRIPTAPRPTKDEATDALTRILRQCRQREVPGTPAVPTPADDTLTAPEIQR